MDILFQRRSIRKYIDKQVSEESIEYMLRAAFASPSARNQQTSHFLVVTDKEKLNQIPSVLPYGGMAKTAACAIIVLCDTSLIKSEGFWIQDLSAATQNILLAATREELGAVWIGVYPREERVEGLRKLFDIPEEIIPFSLVCVGHPAEEIAPNLRYIENRIHRNKW